MENNKIWTREFISMMVINSLFTIVFFLFMVTMIPYAKDTHNVSLSMAGLVASVFVIGSLIGRIISSKLIALYGSLKVLTISLVISIIISLGYLIAFNIEILFSIRILHGIATGIISTATGTIGIQAVPITRRSEGISYYNFSAVIGSAIGPFLGISLINIEGGYQWIFILNLLFGLISFIILRVSKLSVPHVIVENEKGLSISNFIEFKALPISLIALIIGFCLSGITSYLVNYTNEIKLPHLAGYYFFVHTICIVCTRIFTGKLMDAKGVSIVIYPCLIFFSIGSLLYSQTTNVWIFLLAAALISTGFGNFNSGAQTLAIKASPPHRLSTATATYFICIDIGSGLGPYLFGFIIESLGYRTLYVCIAIVGVICVALYAYCYPASANNKTSSVEIEKYS